jgi:hypothetical protein
MECKLGWVNFRRVSDLGVLATSLGVTRITVEQAGKNKFFFGNASGAPGNHSYYLSYNDFWNLCIQFVFVSIYLCIYIATHLNTVYLDWLQAVLQSNSRCAWKWWSSELSDKIWGCDRVSLEMHVDATIERIWRNTWRQWSHENWDGHQDRDRATLEIHLEAVIKPVWRCTCRPSSCELRGCERASLELHLRPINVRTGTP